MPTVRMLHTFDQPPTSPNTRPPVAVVHRRCAAAQSRRRPGAAGHGRPSDAAVVLGRVAAVTGPIHKLENPTHSAILMTGKVGYHNGRG